MLQYLNDVYIQKGMKEMAKVTKALVSAFNRFKTFMEYM